VYANLNGTKILLCHASISRQKVIVKLPREQRREKKEASSYLVWPRSRPVTSRWGFQLRYHCENNILRVTQRNVSSVHVQRTSKLLATCTRFYWQPKAQNKI